MYPVLDLKHAEDKFMTWRNHVSFLALVIYPQSYKILLRMYYKH